MPAIIHYTIHQNDITPEAQRVLDTCEVPWKHAIPDRAGVRVYDFCLRFPQRPGNVIRYAKGISVEQGVTRSYYQMTETEVIIVTTEQRDGKTHHAIRLMENTPKEIDTFFHEYRYY